MLGVGLTAALAAVTLALWVTGRLGWYINPESSWFAVTMAILALIGVVASFALPRGAAAEHGHDHGHDHDHSHDHSHAPGRSHSDLEERAPAAPRTPPLTLAATLSGGAVAGAIVIAAVLVPPATLSAELAMQRDTGTPPLFQGADTIALAASGDTSAFGIGEWASVFATATNPESFDGQQVTLTGFVTPGSDGFALTRLVITHCVIDAQPAMLPIATSSGFDTGQWVQVTGTIRDSGGRLQIDASDIEAIAQPEDPYEY